MIFRDRVSYGRRCLASLMAAGLEPVVVDHGSSWPEAVQWLDHLDRSGVMVLRGHSGHPRGIWNWGMFRVACGGSERYIVTDPDVVPSEDCPGDWVRRLSEVLDKAPHYCHKAGLGLRLDRLPAQREQRITEHESQYWRRELAPGVFDAPVDTTLALHVPLNDCGTHSFEAQRTGFPYVADHLAWYESSDWAELPEENRYYYQHAEPDITTWVPDGRRA